MRDIDQVKALLASVDQSDESIAQKRSGQEAFAATIPIAEGVQAEPVSLRGVSGLKLSPNTVIDGRALLYFHGGGYVMGSSSSHKALVSHLARAMQATAFSMDYALAPERPFPAAVHDGLASYRGLLDKGYSSDHIVIAGDSAGGGLTVATAMKIRDDGLPKPAGLALLSPWVNLANDGWSYDANAAKDPMLRQTALSELAAAYVDDQRPKTPYASPIEGGLTGLPPIYIQAGGDEILLSDSTSLAERAGAAGVFVTLEVWPEMVHVFQYFHEMLADAREAIDRLGAWAAYQTR